MTLLLDLSPQKEKELQEALKMKDSAHVRQLLNSALDELVSSLLQKSDLPLAETEWDRELDALAALVDSDIPDDAPVLMEQYLSRERIYSNHL